MIKIHYEIDKFDNKELLKGYNGIIKKEFNNNNYFIELYQDDKKLIALKANEGLLFINGDYILLDDLVKNIIYLGLNFKTVLINKLIEEQFIGLVEKEQGGRFIKLKTDNEEYSLLEYTKGNVKSCVLAGGCFWCMSKPYYEYDGIKKVYSGYSGGIEIFPNYEDVKKQKTSHKECVKLIYDESKISFKEILDIYFETIDPFDEYGQFIDRGESYTTAIFYKTDEEKIIANKYIEDIEKRFGKKVAVKVLEENIFYMAEEYHQDYAIKNPEEMERELIESGRK